MSVQAQTWVFEFSQAKYGDRLVLLSIANHADARGDNAWPAIATIAREARLSTRQVRRALLHLVRLGELKLISGKESYKTNLYHLPKMAQSSLFGKSVRKAVHKGRKKGG